MPPRHTIIKLRKNTRAHQFEFGADVKDIAPTSYPNIFLGMEPFALTVIWTGLDDFVLKELALMENECVDRDDRLKLFLCNYATGTKEKMTPFKHYKFKAYEHFEYGGGSPENYDPEDPLDSVTQAAVCAAQSREMLKQNHSKFMDHQRSCRLKPNRGDGDIHDNFGVSKVSSFTTDISRFVSMTLPGNMSLEFNHFCPDDPMVSPELYMFSVKTRTEDIEEFSSYSKFDTFVLYEAHTYIMPDIGTEKFLKAMRDPQKPSDFYQIQMVRQVVNYMTLHDLFFGIISNESYVRFIAKPNQDHPDKDGRHGGSIWISRPFPKNTIFRCLGTRDISIFGYISAILNHIMKSKDMEAQWPGEGIQVFPESSADIFEMELKRINQLEWYTLQFLNPEKGLDSTIRGDFDIFRFNQHLLDLETTGELPDLITSEFYEWQDKQMERAERERKMCKGKHSKSKYKKQKVDFQEQEIKQESEILVESTLNASSDSSYDESEEKSEDFKEFSDIYTCYNDSTENELSDQTQFVSVSQITNCTTLVGSADHSYIDLEVIKGSEAQQEHTHQAPEEEFPENGESSELFINANDEVFSIYQSDTYIQSLIEPGNREDDEFTDLDDSASFYSTSSGSNELNYLYSRDEVEATDFGSTHTSFHGLLLNPNFKYLNVGELQTYEQLCNLESEKFQPDSRGFKRTSSQVNEPPFDLSMYNCGRGQRLHLFNDNGMYEHIDFPRARGFFNLSAEFAIREDTKKIHKEGGLFSLAIARWSDNPWFGVCQNQEYIRDREYLPAIMNVTFVGRKNTVLTKHCEVVIKNSQYKYRLESCRNKTYDQVYNEAAIYRHLSNVGCVENIVPEIYVFGDVWKSNKMLVMKPWGRKLHIEDLEHDEDGLIADNIRRAVTKLHDCNVSLNFISIDAFGIDPYGNIRIVDLKSARVFDSEYSEVVRKQEMESIEIMLENQTDFAGQLQLTCSPFDYTEILDDADFTEPEDLIEAEIFPASPNIKLQAGCPEVYAPSKAENTKPTGLKRLLTKLKK